TSVASRATTIATRKLIHNACIYASGMVLYHSSVGFSGGNLAKYAAVPSNDEPTTTTNGPRRKAKAMNANIQDHRQFRQSISSMGHPLLIAHEHSRHHQVHDKHQNQKYRRQR